MLLVQDVVVAEGLVDLPFTCDLRLCHGACCVLGDVGSRVSPREIARIGKVLPAIIALLSETHQHCIKRAGFVYLDQGIYRLRLAHPTGPCVFSFQDSNTTKCALHHYDERGLTPEATKPAWCSLFPIKYICIKDIKILTLATPDYCLPCYHGTHKLYQTFKPQLIRVLGEAWYQELERVIALRSRARDIQVDDGRQ